jgi:hypothetical protein
LVDHGGQSRTATGSGTTCWISPENHRSGVGENTQRARKIECFGAVNCTAFLTVL